MPSETYTSNGVFPLSGTLSDYTITQIEIAGAGGGASIFGGVGGSTNTGGNGARIYASDFENILYTENSLQIYIGRKGTFTEIIPNLIASSGSGGGSSSIVGTNTGTTILVAGAGGGAGVSDNGMTFGGNYEQQGGSAAPDAIGGGFGFGGFGGSGGYGLGKNGISGNPGTGGSGGSSFVAGANPSLIAATIPGGIGNGFGNGGEGVLYYVTPGSTSPSLTGGGGGGYGGGGGGGADDTAFGAGGGGGGNFINGVYILTTNVQSANNAGTYETTAGDGYVTITYTVNSPAICLLSDCDVLLSDFTLKNITEITLSDEVIGYLSKRPEKIKKVIKHTHLVNSLEETNKPYLIPMNTFGSNSPDKDIHLSGHHRIIVQTENNHFAGVQTFKLGNCKKETNNSDEVDYYHIILENRGVGLIVNNLPVEDCVDEFKNV
jgi:hypothetical protein